ncbi:MAG: IS3 family transposase, partial [Nanoarchaeota archaeon]|nr:IS3 family transposase [Nanoarchaeota archaeon]MBU4451395.1 IS3 family transposase [Nanoarchaeota archaeon]MCG2724189.1 IS3 family transposase [archaeon]
GQSINHKKVLSIMRNDNLLCIRKKFRIITTDSNHNLPVFQNLIKDIEKSALKQLNPHNSA